MEDEAGVSNRVRHDIVRDPQSLIHLFSPPVPPFRTDPDISPQRRRALWTEDSVHRAKNLAQLAAALGHIGPGAVAPSYLDAIADNARALASAYVELAEEHPCSAPAPCATLLTRIMEGLIGLFGHGPRPVALSCTVSEIWLPHQMRRALVLIASELVVNALKYAFPEQGGTIVVTLVAQARHVELTVQDDGVGMGVAAKPGGGSRILDELAMLLRAPVERTPLPGGGLRVSVRVPLTIET